METRGLRRNWLSPVISYSILSWTILCFAGTWFIILKYGILLDGFVAVTVTFLFAATAWVIPLTGLILLSLFITPSEESRSSVVFRN